MKELRVRLGDLEAAKNVWFLCGFLIVVGLLAPVGAWLDGQSSQGVIGFAAFGAAGAGFPIWMHLLLTKAHSRLATYELISDSEEIRLERDGNPIWVIAWSEYGGLQECPVDRREFIRVQENRSLSVLNQSGQIIGEIPGFLSSQSPASAQRVEIWRAIVRELKTKSLSKIEFQERSAEFRNATPRSAIISGLVGVVVSVPPAWILGEVLSYWRAGIVSYPWVMWFAESSRLAILLIPLLFGLTVGIWGISALLLKKASIAEAKTHSHSADVDQHRLAVLDDGGKVILRDGDCYEYADPDWICHRLNQTIVPAKALIAMVLGLAIVATVVPQGSPPPPWGFWVGLSLFGVALIGACLFSIHTYTDLKLNLHDQFRVTGTQLTVNKPSGEEIDVLLPPNREFRLPALGQFSIKAFQRQDGKKYRIDPAYLRKRKK